MGKKEGGNAGCDWRNEQSDQMKAAQAKRGPATPALAVSLGPENNIWE